MARSGEFNEGKAAYERGRYKKAVELLELARDREGTMSALVSLPPPLPGYGCALAQSCAR